MYSAFSIPSFSEKYLSFGKAIVRTGVLDCTFQQHNCEFLFTKWWKNIFSSRLVSCTVSLDTYPCIPPVSINNFLKAVYFLNMPANCPFMPSEKLSLNYPVFCFNFFLSSVPYSCPIYLQRNFRHIS